MVSFLTGIIIGSLLASIGYLVMDKAREDEGESWYISDIGEFIERA